MIHDRVAERVRACVPVQHVPCRPSAAKSGLAARQKPVIRREIARQRQTGTEVIHPQAAVDRQSGYPPVRPTYPQAFNALLFLACRALPPALIVSACFRLLACRSVLSQRQLSGHTRAMRWMDARGGVKIRARCEPPNRYLPHYQAVAIRAPHEGQPALLGAGRKHTERNVF